MRTPFSLGLGGRIGSGTQWMSWVSLHDLVALLVRALHDDALRGPINATAPEPVTNAAFTAALGRALGRPAVIPVPALAIRLALGEMAEVMLLGGQRVVPRALLGLGFAFAHPTIDLALAAVLAK
jgi:uncharacterized protein (TIGR01777 family)